MSKVQLLFLMIAQGIAANGFAQQLSATQIVKKSDDLMRGKSAVSTMTMEIVRPTWKRSITFKNWEKGRDLALTLITAPARDKDQSFLKIKNEMWSWNPSINRVIKLPPSMLSQGWMGSDYTNDDVLKESSIVDDYIHKIIKEEALGGYPCYVIELTPKPDAAVVWGKIITYISKDNYFSLKADFYDEEGVLVKTHLAYDVKRMDDRQIPTRMEIIPADEPGNKTLVLIEQITFNVQLQDDFFSQQSMKRVR